MQSSHSSEIRDLGGKQCPSAQPQHPVFSSSADPTNAFITVNYSAQVGWIPTVISKSYLVAPILIPTANP